MTESEVQRSIMDYLTLRRVWFRRYSNRAYFIGKRPLYPIRRPDNKPDNGHPDIIAKMRHATVNIECKAAKGIQSAEQKAWQAEAEERGEIYILARSLEDVRALFEPRKPCSPK